MGRHLMSFHFFLLSCAVRDMQQMYELWLHLTNQSRRSDSAAVTPPPEDKQVNITADYTESMVSVSVSEPCQTPTHAARGVYRRKHYSVVHICSTNMNDKMFNSIINS